ncbi:MAG: cytochrome c biogenesis protein DipZ [Candidatus Gracilibacteria bacterium]
MFSLFILAFIGGFLTIAAPCILAVLPIILGSTIGQQSRLRPFFIVLGLTVSFTAFGVIFQYVTNLFGLTNNTLRNVALVFLGVFGLALIFPSVFEKVLFHLQNFFNRLVPPKQAILPETQKKKGLINGFLVGASLGLVWVPCAGPILGAILTLAVTQQDLGKVILLMLAYSLGAGLPMLLIAYGGNFIVTRLKFLKERGILIQKISGVVLMLGVIFIALGLDVKISTQLADLFPSFNQFEQSLVESSGIRGGKTGTQESKTGSQNTEIPKTEGSKNAIQKLLMPQKTFAPELTGTQEWINSRPLKLANLRGKVVIVDFWTYSCINCIRTLPYINTWHKNYKDKGLVIIGVHTPEFGFEKELSNVQKAVKDFGVEYPVVQDNEYATWRAYDNHYWPAKYIIDKEGYVRYVHFGEGKYDETEMVIQELLGEKVGKLSDVQASGQDLNKIQTPEIYLGYDRAEYYGNMEKYPAGESGLYQFPSEVKNDTYYLEGEWKVESEFLSATKVPAKLSMNYLANKINIVADKTKDPVKARLYLDGKPLPEKYFGKDVSADGTVTINKAALYNLVDTGNDYARHTLTLEFLNTGVKAFTFTFGGDTGKM